MLIIMALRGGKTDEQVPLSHVHQLLVVQRVLLCVVIVSIENEEKDTRHPPRQRIRHDGQSLRRKMRAAADRRR